jgi:hypothetical protein
MSDSGSDVSDEEGEGFSSMMAAYYGMEEPAADPAEDETKSAVEDQGDDYGDASPSSHGRTNPSSGSNSNSHGDIDGSNFDSARYVRNLLNNNLTEDLIAKDARMVHEIRTLDGDMQMLVYENYNKFIAATETIKRMKVNVESMESDMSDVRTKMEAISTASTSLDNSLVPNRDRVDKLVRLKRLLERLGFLSELPERLEKMISRRQYNAAVDLYRKTLSVLTRYQDVASFKNIHDRIELMMKDLRVKVRLLSTSLNLPQPPSTSLNLPQSPSNM